MYQVQNYNKFVKIVHVIREIHKKFEYNHSKNTIFIFPTQAVSVKPKVCSCFQTISINYFIFMLILLNIIVARILSIPWLLLFLCVCGVCVCGWLDLVADK